MSYILFVDTNVILDDFLKRKPAGEDCRRIFKLAEKGEITVYTSSGCLLTTIYFLKKAGMPNSIVAQIIKEVLQAYKLVSPDESTILAGLHLGFNDLEDAMQYSTALT